MGRDLAVNGNFSFRLSGIKHAAFQRMDLPTLFFFLPGSYVLKQLKGLCVRGGGWQCVWREASRKGREWEMIVINPKSFSGCSSSVYEMP